MAMLFEELVPEALPVVLEKDGSMKI